MLQWDIQDSQQVKCPIKISPKYTTGVSWEGVSDLRDEENFQMSIHLHHLKITSDNHPPFCCTLCKCVCVCQLQLSELTRVFRLLTERMRLFWSLSLSPSHTDTHTHRALHTDWPLFRPQAVSLNNVPGWRFCLKCLFWNSEINFLFYAWIPVFLFNANANIFTLYKVKELLKWFCTKLCKMCNTEQDSRLDPQD